jgi:hypothetical protein
MALISSFVCVSAAGVIVGYQKKGEGQLTMACTNGISVIGYKLTSQKLDLSFCLDDLASS